MLQLTRRQSYPPYRVDWRSKPPNWCLFAGPTGVGKPLSKQWRFELFCSADKVWFVSICQEYMVPRSLNWLCPSGICWLRRSWSVNQASCRESLFIWLFDEAQCSPRRSSRSRYLATGFVLTDYQGHQSFYILISSYIKCGTGKVGSKLALELLRESYQFVLN